MQEELSDELAPAADAHLLEDRLEVVLDGGSLGEPLGWACVVAGLALGGSYLVIGDTLPAFVYIPTAAVGLAMLLSSR